MATRKFADEISYGSISVPAIMLPDVPEDDNIGDWGAPSVNERCADLVSQESTVLADGGIDTSTSELLFDAGTRLADIGHDTLKADDAAYKALPMTDVALAALKATITAEARKDTKVNLVDFRVDADGKLARKEHATGGKGVAIEHTPWRQLQALAEGPNVNAGLSTRKHADRRVRARTIEGKRSVFAIVSANASKGYTVCDAGTVADLVSSGLKDAGMLSGSRTEVTYDQPTTRYKMRTILQAPIDIPAFRGVGRVHQLFLDVWGADDGMASIEGLTGAMRIRCMNATKSLAEGASFSKVHKGDLNEIRRLVSGLTRQFGTVAKSLSDVWMRASAEYYLDSESGARLSPQEAITRLVVNGLVPTGERTEEQAIDRYVAAWRAEDSPSSAAGIIMAVQRAAHESDWGSKWATDSIESTAAEMLYQPVYTLASA